MNVSIVWNVVPEPGIGYTAQPRNSPFGYRLVVDETAQGEQWLLQRRQIDRASGESRGEWSEALLTTDSVQAGLIQSEKFIKQDLASPLPLLDDDAPRDVR